MRSPLAAAAFLSLVAAPFLAAETPLQRANDLLAQMTQAEKIALAASGAAVPRLGIPALKASDGPNGVRLALHPTAFPGAETVAASWDVGLADRFGSAVGAEAFGTGFNLLFAPTVNILRTPRWGRAAETLGEDPYLSGQIAAAEVRGVQRQHVIAQVKHYAANNQEIERFGDPAAGGPQVSQAVDVHVSEQALEEIYLPAFKAAVQQGQAASAMCSYPRVNGVYACQNAALLGELKTGWGFLGFVGPDASLAVRDTLAAINAGTDNFILGSAGASPASVLPGVAPGRLDDMVRRTLTAMATVGLLDVPNTGTPGAAVSTPDHVALAKTIAASGSVLLKNAGNALPLTAGVHSIAVIGYDAGAGTQTTEGGSAAVTGGPVVTPLARITARAGGGATVTYAPGTLGVVPLPVVPASVLMPSSGTGPGLLETSYASGDLTGSPLGAFVTPTIDATAALPVGALSARWTGTLTPPTTGTYRFSLTAAGISRLTIDGVPITGGDAEGLDGFIAGAPRLAWQGLATLTAGVPVPITVEYQVGSSIFGSNIHLGWQPPDPSLVAAAVAAASAADVAVVFVNDVTGEGMDRATLALPGDQDALIQAVAAANARTIVVLHTAGPVLMPWLGQVAAVIEAWYPGQESGNAIAALLFGDVDATGRLPMTFPASDGQGPATQASQYPGVGGVVSYDEGIDVGYRYYDRVGQTPLFPFGYGLSYTSFSLSGLRVGRRAHGTYRVSVNVRNTGDRPGTAVVQLYVAFPVSTGEPLEQLKAFGTIALRPHQRKVVKLGLDPSSFSTWSTVDHAASIVPGSYRIGVGTSSRDLPLQATIAQRPR